MKRVFLLVFTALAALMAASCQKEEMGRVLTATIEQYEHNSKGGNDASKAYINNEYYACWENNDLVQINNTRCTVSVSPESITASILGTENLTERPLLAYYPASQVSNLTAAGGTVTLPPVQTYETTTVNGVTYQKIQNPMAAYCPEGNDKLKFRNLGALLKVTIQGNTSVKAIQVKGDDNQMLWGEATLKLNNQNLPMLDKFSKGSNSVVLNFPSAVSIDGGRSFYIVVPAGSLFTNLTIAVLTTNGTTNGTTYAHHCKTSAMGQGLLRNQIGAVNYTPNGCEDNTFLPSWMIRYTATDRVTPHNASAFGAAVVDNPFNAPNGTLLFDGPVTEIGSQAFHECSSLTGISLSESVTSIGNSTFYGCNSLAGIDLPESLTSIGESAFSYCYGLTGISLPESLTSIGDEAFYSCSNLTSISLPESLTSIGTGAFSGCRNLTSISLPESLTSIGMKAFQGCSSLAGIDLPESLTSIGMQAFENCSSLTSISLPENVTSIGMRAFAMCSSLAGIDLPESLTSIGDAAFEDCSSLGSISLPANVTSIEGRAFAGCSELFTVNCYASNPPALVPDAFNGIQQYAVLRVPSNRVAAYSGSNWGSAFASPRHISGNL